MVWFTGVGKKWFVRLPYSEKITGSIPGLSLWRFSKLPVGFYFNVVSLTDCSVMLTFTHTNVTVQYYVTSQKTTFTTMTSKKKR